MDFEYLPNYTSPPPHPPQPPSQPSHRNEVLNTSIESKSDFYSILVSNGCMDLHDDNGPSKYKTTWENTKIMNEKCWKVALTEANFYYPKYTLTTNHSMRIRKLAIFKSPEFKLGFEVKIDTYMNALNKISPESDEQYYGVFPVPERTSFFDYVPERPDFDFTFPFVYSFRETDASYEFSVVIYSKHRFTIKFKNDSYVFLGFDSPYQKSTWNLAKKAHILKSPPMKQDRDWVYEVAIWFYSGVYTEEIIVNIPDNILFDRAEEMASYFQSKFPDVFRRVGINTSGIVEMDFQKGIVGLIFDGRLNIPLGFRKKNYSNLGKWTKEHSIRGDFKPILNIGLDHLYIYSSVCRPIHVGGQLVPLLKSIWLDGKRKAYSHGEVINIILNNPMYVPVSSSAINSIEVNIRNDYGKLIPFPEGSVTSLTLHFKNYG